MCGCFPLPVNYNLNPPADSDVTLSGVKANMAVVSVSTMSLLVGVGMLCRVVLGDGWGLCLCCVTFCG